MTRMLILILVVICLATLIGLAIVLDPGYVLISYKGFRYQSGIWFFLGIFLGVGILFWLLSITLNVLLGGMGWVNPWSGYRRDRRRQKSAGKGTRELAEGRWQPALAHLRHAGQGREGMVYLLGAAQAANEAGDHGQCDALLDQGLERDPDSRLAVQLTRSGMQMSRGDYSLARDTLLDLRKDYPKQFTVLRRLHEVYLQLNDWVGLAELLPALQKLRILSPAELDNLEQRVWLHALYRAASDASGQGEYACISRLQQQWQRIPAALHSRPPLVCAYAHLLHHAQATDSAVALLTRSIEHDWHEETVSLYGQIAGGSLSRQIAKAEKWLQKHPDDFVLLLALGRLCLADRLWGKARGYLQASHDLWPTVDTCMELGRLQVQQGHDREAGSLFLQGIGLLRQRTALPGPLLADSSGE